MKIWLRSGLVLGIALLLFACESEKMQRTATGMQQNYFLQSLHLVESAGEVLQQEGLKQDDIEGALANMDNGLEQAFEVEREFLKRLDVRLPKYYQELFITGVQEYRLGVESSNREQQVEGLELLSRWSQFWLKEKSKVLQKLEKLND
jgi:hypothetical protein